MLRETPESQRATYFFVSERLAPPSVAAVTGTEISYHQIKRNDIFGTRKGPELTHDH